MPDFIEGFRYIQENTSNFKSIITRWTWLIQESPGLKPDWLGNRRFLAWEKLNISLNMSLSKDFPAYRA